MNHKEKALETARRRLESDRVRIERFGGVFSGFRGVSWHELSGKFRAQIEVGGNRVTMSSQSNVECAKFYDEQASRMMGDCAVTNKMLGLL